MRVEEIMAPKVSVVTPETSVKDVAEQLVRHGFGSLPVVDADGELVGIITEADLIAVEASAPDPRRHARRDLPAGGPTPRTAADLMTTPVIAARVGTDVADLAKIMLAAHLTRIPVLDDRGRLVGLVSRSDLLKPLTRPDADIEADVRRVLAEWGVTSTAGVHVENGEVTLTTVVGRLHPEVDPLVRAIPGVIAVRHSALGADAAVTARRSAAYA